jgi:hypothetical protein
LCDTGLGEQLTCSPPFWGGALLGEGYGKGRSIDMFLCLWGDKRCVALSSVFKPRKVAASLSSGGGNEPVVKAQVM